MKYLAFVLLLASCAHHASSNSAGSPVTSGGAIEHVQGRAPEGAPKLYSQAVNELEIGQNATALEDFDKFSLQAPASAYAQATLLNSGRALENLRRWDQASDRYRQVLGGTGRAPRLQAMALYRLSVVHEAQGDDAQVVADLNDLLKRTAALPPETSSAEVPARLAGAYARVGNFEKSQEFYRRAEAGIARLRQGAKTPAWLPETLRAMGSSVHEVTWDGFETALRPLARGQVYLMESAELGNDKAADDLIAQYDSMMSVIEQAPLPDGEPLLARRALQRKQWDRAGLLSDALTDLRARALPESKTTAVKRINEELKKIDSRIAGLLEQRPAGEGLTAASLERRRLRRGGHASGKLPLFTDSSSDSLEQAFLKSAKANPTVSPPLAPRAAGASPVGQLPLVQPTSNGVEPIHSAPAPTPSETTTPSPTPSAAPAPTARPGDPNL